MANPYAPSRAKPDKQCDAKCGEYRCTLHEDHDGDVHAHVDENMSWLATWQDGDIE